MSDLNTDLKGEDGYPKSRLVKVNDKDLVITSGTYPKRLPKLDNEGRLPKVDDKGEIEHAIDNPPKNIEELTEYIQLLLQHIQTQFQTMSDQILTRIDDMGTRIDELDKNLQDLMTQAGVDYPDRLP